MNVGVRDLRSHLKRYLDAVKDGEEVVVTEYGHPVARIVPVAGAAALDRLVASGVLTRPTAPASRRGGARRLPSKGDVSAFVKEQRR